MKKVINTLNAPTPVGPYSQAISFNNILFISGQIPINPDSGDIVIKSFSEQCHRVILNLKIILEEGGSSLDHVLKTSIFLKNLNQFDELNEIYSQYFKKSKPARTCIEVSNLPKGVDLEMDAIAEIYFSIKS